jgi:hypothetical protein
MKADLFGARKLAPRSHIQSFLEDPATDIFRGLRAFQNGARIDIEIGV